MTISKSFFRFAAVCAFITALTTIVVHVVPNYFAAFDTFAERIELRNNRIYITRFWFVLLHCALVVISMYAVGIKRLFHAPVLVPLGFLCFVIFAFTEWLRTTLGIFALNRTWRAAYAQSAETSLRQFQENYISAFSGFNDAFFFIFFVCFITGCACYGFAYRSGAGWEKKIGWLFLFWAFTGVPTVVDYVVQTNIGTYFSWMSWYPQLIARMLIAVWLWRTANPLVLR